MSRIVIVHKMLKVHEIKDSNDTKMQKLGSLLLQNSFLKIQEVAESSSHFACFFKKNLL